MDFYRPWMYVVLNSEVTETLVESYVIFITATKHPLFGFMSEIFIFATFINYNILQRSSAMMFVSFLFPNDRHTVKLESVNWVC